MVFSKEVQGQESFSETHIEISHRGLYGNSSKPYTPTPCHALPRIALRDDLDAIPNPFFQRVLAIDIATHAFGSTTNITNPAAPELGYRGPGSSKAEDFGTGGALCQ